jgi:hypothetical protein
MKLSMLTPGSNQEIKQITTALDKNLMIKSIKIFYINKMQTSILEFLTRSIFAIIVSSISSHSVLDIFDFVLDLTLQ